MEKYQKSLFFCVLFVACQRWRATSNTQGFRSSWICTATPPGFCRSARFHCLLYWYWLTLSFTFQSTKSELRPLLPLPRCWPPSRSSGPWTTVCPKCPTWPSWTKYFIWSTHLFSTPWRKLLSLSTCQSMVMTWRNSRTELKSIPATCFQPCFVFCCYYCLNRSYLTKPIGISWC